MLNLAAMFFIWFFDFWFFLNRSKNGFNLHRLLCFLELFKKTKQRQIQLRILQISSLLHVIFKSTDDGKLRNLIWKCPCICLIYAVVKHSPVVCRSFQSACSVRLSLSKVSMSSGSGASSCPREGAGFPRREEAVTSTDALSFFWKQRNKEKIIVTKN